MAELTFYKITDLWMGEMTPVECWVKESNHGEPKKKAGLNHGLKTLRRWWPTGSMYLLVALNLTQSKMGLYNRSTADILNKMALYINRYKCLVSLGKLKVFWRLGVNIHTATSSWKLTTNVFYTWGTLVSVLSSLQRGHGSGTMRHLPHG